jgi:hypothetical protein
MSDGTILTGGLSLTPGKKLRPFDTRGKEYVDVSLDTLREIRVTVSNKSEEQEWRFKEAGSAQKVFTGKVRPRLDFAYEFLPKDEPTLTTTLSVGVPLYILLDRLPGSADSPAPLNNPVRVLLRPYVQGEMGKTFADLVYPARIVFGDDAKAEAIKEVENKGQKPVDPNGALPAGVFQLTAEDEPPATREPARPVWTPQEAKIPDRVSQMSDWTLYTILVFTFSQLLLLGFVVALAYRLSRLMREVRALSQDASKFLRMGIHYFKTQK